MGMAGFSSPATSRYSLLSSALPGTIAAPFFAALQRRIASAQIELGKLNGRAVALPATALKDRLDIFGERDRLIRRSQDQCRGQRQGSHSNGHNSPPEILRVCPSSL